MLYFSRAKTFGILLLCGLGILLSLPNLSARPSFWPGFLPWNQVHMGLDLRGGSYLLLQIDTSAIVKQDLNALVDETRQTLRNAQLGYTGLHADLASNQVVLHPLEGQSQQDMTALQKLISYAPGSSSPSVALSTLPDGAIAIAIPPATQAARNSQAVDQAITIIQRRIDGSGVLNPSIQRQGADQIVVQLPGISDPDRVKTLIGTTAHMTFQMVDATAAPGPVAPLGDEQLPMAGNPQQMMDVYANVAVDGASLENAQASTDPQSGQWVVNFTFNALGARQFADVTTANVGKLFAIVLDGKVISAPVIREPITGGRGQISGNFTAPIRHRPRAAAARRRPARAARQWWRNRASDRSWARTPSAPARSRWASGFVLVIVFMATFYGLFGWFANVALVVNLFLMLAILSVLGATLTLPGMAGILLTLGMAVDANILINERIREEVKNGRTPLAALEAGYKRAYGTIIDSNVTTFLAHVMLFIFGSRPGARLRRHHHRRHRHHHVHRHGAGAAALPRAGTCPAARPPLPV